MVRTPTPGRELVRRRLAVVRLVRVRVRLWGGQWGARCAGVGIKRLCCASVAYEALGWHKVRRAGCGIARCWGGIWDLLGCGKVRCKRGISECVGCGGGGVLRCAEVRVQWGVLVLYSVAARHHSHATPFTHCGFAHYRTERRTAMTAYIQPHHVSGNH
jgi:hypothetical protein